MFSVKMLHKDTLFNKGLKVFFILLPLFLSAAWLISVTKNKVTVVATETGLKLSPYYDTAPIIYGLIIFKVGYLTFIYLMFRNEVKDLYHTLAKRLHSQNK